MTCLSDGAFAVGGPVRMHRLTEMAFETAAMDRWMVHALTLTLSLKSEVVAAAA